MLARPCSVFAALMAGQAVPYFYPFDLHWLDGHYWRQRPLLERQPKLARLIGRQKGRLLYCDHLLERGCGLYELACG